MVKKENNHLKVLGRLAPYWIHLRRWGNPKCY